MSDEFTGSEQTRAWIREIAFEAAKAVAKQLDKKLDTALLQINKDLKVNIELHALACPVAKTVSYSKAFMAGVAFVCSGIGAAVALLVAPLWKKWTG